MHKLNVIILISILVIVGAIANVFLLPQIQGQAVEPPCDNYNEIQDFKKPIPIIWTARFTGCLVSCSGAHFTRVPEEAKYKFPRFAGYFSDTLVKYYSDKDGLQILDEFKKNNTVLNIYGNWGGIGDEYVSTVFGGRCVPVVDIEKIEIVK